MEQTRLFELLVKEKEGVISLDEQLELKRLMRIHTSDEDIEECLDVLFGHRLIAEGYTDSVSVEKSLEVFNQKLAHASNTKILKPLQLFIIAVSAIFLMIGIGLFEWLNNAGNSGVQQVVSTKGRSKTSLILPDGSNVWINEKTRLWYNTKFGREQRDVYLDGEAYFDVVKNKSKPFVVHTKQMDIKVLGTEFNVRAFDSGYVSETTLIRGRVEVFVNQKRGEKVVLKPNEKLIVQHQRTNSGGNAAKGGNMEVPEIVVSMVIPNLIDSGFLETQWLKDNISFEQQSLIAIIPMLEKWYGVVILVKSPSLRGMRFSGKIDKESLREVLESFKLAGGIQYHINKDTVIVQ